MSHRIWKKHVHCTLNLLAKEIEVIPGRDGKTNFSLRVDRTGFISVKCN
jgi:hypothetical protein